ncbi:MAG TPA: DUF447 family protein [Methylophaga aminisulfidivorans]|uniref:DUF447 family protein n=2 Tax=root TaxID=1 RepID=A0A7C1VNH8_9GAMM|nr:DUF447 family protein [Methylophaga aminisulfidivorans]
MARLTSRIHEVIVTTLSESGEPHHAPMGISEVNDYFLIKPFKPSSTYNNLKRHGQCTINYVDDVRVFAGALTERREWPVLAANSIDSMYLACALSHTELRIDQIDDDDPRATFYAKVVSDYTHQPFRGFNRAQNAVVETAILVSRLGMLPEEKITQELTYHRISIEKTAGERELEAWGWLMEKIRAAGINIDD